VNAVVFADGFKGGARAPSTDWSSSGTRWPTCRHATQHHAGHPEVARLGDNICLHDARHHDPHLVAGAAQPDEGQSLRTASEQVDFEGLRARPE
jgi:hypothetical protein